MFRLLCFTGGLLVCLLLVGLVPDSAQAYAFQRENMATQSGNGIAASSHANTTVFVIMMENHRWVDIFRNPDAPYINRTLHTHSSLLRTVEEIFGVTPLLGDAAHAVDLRDLFVAFP